MSKVVLTLTDGEDRVDFDLKFKPEIKCDAELTRAQYIGLLIIELAKSGKLKELAEEA